jgi:hypothetical protein
MVQRLRKPESEEKRIAPARGAPGAGSRGVGVVESRPCCCVGASGGTPRAAGMGRDTALSAP